MAETRNIKESEVQMREHCYRINIILSDYHNLKKTEKSSGTLTILNTANILQPYKQLKLSQFPSCEWPSSFQSFTLLNVHSLWRSGREEMAE